MPSFQSLAARRGGQPVQFDIDGEVFHALPVMPGDSVLALAAVAESTSNADRAAALMGILDAVLLPESAQRFAARMKGGDHPLTVEDVANVVRWLTTEVYSDRPTAGASPSPSGSAAPGMPSTDGALPATSTPSPSPSPGS